jgi:Mn2+/Fe2+ NRAMP family transporter
MTPTVPPELDAPTPAARVGEFANSRWTAAGAWVVAITIIGFNAALLWLAFHS